MFKIKYNAVISTNDLKSLVLKYKYGRYCEDLSLSLKSSRHLFEDSLINLLETKNTQNITVYSLSDTIQGVLLFKESYWDTEHFGFKCVIIENIITIECEYSQKREIAKLLLEEFNNWCKKKKIKFVSIKISSLNLPVIHEIESNDFNFIESWIYNKYNLEHFEDSDQAYLKLRKAITKDRDIMIDYAKGAFSTQRFYADSNINVDKADSLYKKWIITAFSDPKQDIIVMDIEERPSAFMIYYINDLRKYFGYRFAMWKMGLVDPEKKHKGIGYDFITALFQYHANQGLDIIDSGLSLRNLPSLNWHNKLNFKIISTLVTFHKWY